MMEQVSELIASMPALLTLALVGATYFLPSIVAEKRRHKNIASIVVVNLFLGWTLIGWVVGLAWSLTENTKGQKQTQSS